MHSDQVARARASRWAILSFFGTCMVVFAFPAIMHMIAGHYLNHPVVTPLAVRLLIGIGGFVESFRIPIMIFAGIGLSVILFSKAKSSS